MDNVMLVTGATGTVGRESCTTCAHGGRKVVMIDPRDIGAVAARALTTSGHERKIYELSGQALTGFEIAVQLSEALPVEFVDASDDETRQDLITSGLPAQIADSMLEYFATLRAGQWYETSTVADLLGHRRGHTRTGSATTCRRSVGELTDLVGDVATGALLPPRPSWLGVKDSRVQQ